MKKHILVLLTLVLSTLFAHSQTPDSLKPLAGEKQLTIGLFNNSGFFVFKKYRSPSMACRMGFSGTYQFSKQENSMPMDVQNGPIVTTYYTSNSTRSSNGSINIFFGYQMSLVNYKRFEPYVGMDFSIGNSFLSSTQETSYGVSSVPLGNTISRVKEERRSGFNPQLGILPLTGFNYYIADRFALGAEYRFTIFSLAKRGDENGKRTVTTVYGTSTETEYPETNKGYTISGSLTGSAYITATWFIRPHHGHGMGK